MREEINKLLDEDINIILSNIAAFQTIKECVPYKKMFIENEKDNLMWTINFKNKFNENKTI